MSAKNYDWNDKNSCATRSRSSHSLSSPNSKLPCPASSSYGHPYSFRLCAVHIPVPNEPVYDGRMFQSTSERPCVRVSYLPTMAVL